MYLILGIIYKHVPERQGANSIFENWIWIITSIHSINKDNKLSNDT